MNPLGGFEPADPVKRTGFEQVVASPEVFDWLASDDTLSLAEEAALHAPEPWSPPHVSPEGLTALPEDFPVADPFPRRPATEKIIAIMEEKAICRTKQCGLDDRHVLAREVAEMAVEAIGELQGVAAALYAHDERMVAELLLDALCVLAEDVLKPFFDSAGIVSDIGGEDDE